MHVDPRQLPTDLKQPAVDAGYPPDIFVTMLSCSECQRSHDPDGGRNDDCDCWCHDGDIDFDHDPGDPDCPCDECEVDGDDGDA
jgi:hypothetical protein